MRKGYDYMRYYVKELIPRRPPVLERMEAEADRRGIPIIGPEEARLLQLLAHSIGARRVLELGTAIGYSTLWLAEAVKPRGGSVVTIDRSEGMVGEAVRNIRGAGLKNVKCLMGDAVHLVGEMHNEFDFIFLDIEKDQYCEVLDDCLRLLRRGGLLVADNASWEVLKEFNTVIMNHPDLFTVILPVRDGVSVSLRR